MFATVTTGWGTQSEKVIRKVVTLTSSKGMHDIALVRILSDE